MATAVIWYLKFYKQTSDTSITSLVPQSSVALITTTNPQETISNLSGFEWWNALSGIPFLHNSNEQLKSIQSLIENDRLQTKLNQLPHAVSLHITASDQIETLHFIQSDGFLWSENSIIEILEINFVQNLLQKSAKGLMRKWRLMS